MIEAPILDGAVRRRAAAEQFTARLRLTPLVPADLADLARLFGDPDVMRYIAPNRALTDAEMATRHERALRRWEEQGFAFWRVEDRRTGELLGRGGLFYTDEGGEVEVGYMFVPDAWGRGYATELTRFAVGFGFEVLGLRRITGLVQHPNVASARVLEKAGLAWEKDIEEAGVGLRYFAINRPPG